MEISDVLILEDNPDTANFLSRFMMDHGFMTSVKCDRDTDSLLALKEHNFDLIFLDYNMPGMKVEDALSMFAKLWPSARVALLTATHNAHAIANRLGITMVIEKPFDPDHILARFQLFAVGRAPTSYPLMKRQKDDRAQRDGA